MFIIKRNAIFIIGINYSYVRFKRDDIKKSLSYNMDNMSSGNWLVNVVNKKICENWLGEIHRWYPLKVWYANDSFDLINNFTGS